MNEYVMTAQYVTFICILKVPFMLVSFILLPFAYIIGVVDKITSLASVEEKGERLLNNLLFIPFGPVILVFDTL